jgi:SAM-dependent methyltransferase
MNRTELVLHGLDLEKMTGVEIGPLATPIVTKSRGNVIYVDHTSTEELVKKYGADPNVDTASIVEVDAIWGDQSLADCLGGRKVDYVLASHVGEHVPDLITWLHEIESVLRPGGELRLILPDKRYTFDALRDETRITDLLTAYLLRARRPQVRDVLDFCLHYAPAIAGWDWSRGNYDFATLKPKLTVEHAMDSARYVMENEVYQDVHCWVFSSHTFASLMEKLAGFGLLNLACSGFTDSISTKFEFYVFMKPCTDRELIVESWRKVCEPQQGAWRLGEELEAARNRIKLLENSRSWKLTAPLRRFRSLLRRAV